jgi:formyltetrahydrofolate deformylase
MTSSSPRYALILKCPDTKGVVAAVSGFLAARDASIVEASHFIDADGDLFYMRTEFRGDGPAMPSLEALRTGFAPIADRFDMSWALHDLSVKPKVLIAVSRFGHCLYDLLHRWRSGQLNVDIAGVVSNHNDMRSFVEWSGNPYHHLPVDKNNRGAQEAQLLDLVERLDVDLVVLARYMQILSPELCRALSGRCINIHHSFLPSFKGAKPYHQAHARGVKIIGATAHYVTSDLDEGPIIEQGVERVSHAQTPEQLVSIGRDIECAVLARAVRWHVDHRILLNRQKTVVFT